MRLASVLCCAALAVVSVSCFAPGDLGETPYRCSNDYPECPDGYECQLTAAPNPKNMNKCVKIGGGTMQSLTIPKTMMAPGPFQDAGLRPDNCPDAQFEAPPPARNNTISSATAGFDMGPMAGLAICHADSDGATGDIDVYSVNVAAGEFIRITVSHDIVYGDLDIGLFDGNGTLVPNMFDSDIKSNACIATTQKQMNTAAVYYLVILGARNMATNRAHQNRYNLRVERNNVAIPCAGVTAGDMAMPKDGGVDMAR